MATLLDLAVLALASTSTVVAGPIKRDASVCGEIRERVPWLGVHIVALGRLHELTNLS